MDTFSPIEIKVKKNPKNIVCQFDLVRELMGMRKDDDLLKEILDDSDIEIEDWAEYLKMLRKGE